MGSLSILQETERPSEREPTRISTGRKNVRPRSRSADVSRLRIELTEHGKEDAQSLFSSTMEGSSLTDNESVESTQLQKKPRFELTGGSLLPTRTLPLEYWQREEACKIAKTEHLHYIDDHMDSREEFIRKTTLWKEDPVLEPNMFPYMCPHGVEHWTLWSANDMTEEEIDAFVQKWIVKNMPAVKRWNYDDNLGESHNDSTQDANSPAGPGQWEHQTSPVNDHFSFQEPIFSRSVPATNEGF